MKYQIILIFGLATRLQAKTLPDDPLWNKYGSGLWIRVQSPVAKPTRVNQNTTGWMFPNENLTEKYMQLTHPLYISLYRLLD